MSFEFDPAKQQANIRKHGLNFSLAAPRHGLEGKTMKKLMNNYPLTEDQIRQLAALTGEPDTSDFPETSPEAWKTVHRGPFFKPRKEPVSLRLDMDVMNWLKSKGPGYQTEINAILRRQMEAEISK